MTNSPFFADATTIASVAAVTALLNNGYLEIYNGLQPTDANTAVGAQVCLSNGMRFGATAFATPTAGGSPRQVTANANSISSDTNANGGAGGAATWFRAYKSDGTTVVMDGSVGTSGCDLNLNTTSIVSGATVSCTAFSITQYE